MTAAVDPRAARRTRRVGGVRPRAAMLVAAAVAGAFILGACTSVGYYSQSIGGHLDVLRAARPIDDWLDDASTPAALRARLEKVRAMRRFAVTDLDLPDNRSYTTYADLKRPYVVWSVFAAPPLSLRLQTWCFPVVGCVAYRGYYHKDDAEGFAATLRDEGDDVYVGGIPAYSTLGYTTDPILSTFIGFPEGEVARLIFHELAHQVVYLAGDTTFNESFAVAVEEEGVKRWFRHEAAGDAASAAAAIDYARSVERKRDFIALLTRHRDALEAIYASAASDATKSAGKVAEFAALQADYASMKRDPASSFHDFTGYDRYFAQKLNNANLAAVATYTQRVSAFAKLIAEDQGDMRRFYRDVAALAQLPKPERDARLDALAAAVTVAANAPARVAGIVRHARDVAVGPKP